MKKRIVVKVGSSTLTDDGTTLSYKYTSSLVREIATLQNQGNEVLLVTSGAVALGRKNIFSSKISKKVFAAIGQVALMESWSHLFSLVGKEIAQVLVKKSDILSFQGYSSLNETLEALLEHKIIPVINENDVIDGVSFENNDALASCIANVVGAEFLILITDQEGLYTKDPRIDKEAVLIRVIEDVDSVLSYAGGSGTSFGTGGMVTKVQAAKQAIESGSMTVIASRSYQDVLSHIITGKEVGTKFQAKKGPQDLFGRWQIIQGETICI